MSNSRTVVECMLGLLFQDIPEAPERQMTDKINKVLYFTFRCPVAIPLHPIWLPLNSSQMLQYYPFLPYVAVVNSYNLLFQFNKGGDISIIMVPITWRPIIFSTQKPVCAFLKVEAQK